MRIFFTLFFFLFIAPVLASHIRAGEITWTPVSANACEVQVVLYTLSASPANHSSIQVRWGDHTRDSVFRSSITPMGNGISKYVFTRVHTWPGPGTYTLSVEDDAREAGISNMLASSHTTFYMESKLVIDPLSGAAGSVQMLAPSVLFAPVSKPVSLNMAAYDPEADYLSFEIDTCRDSGGAAVEGYTIPDSVRVNFTTGDFVWTGTRHIGVYGFAVKIRKYRNGQMTGYVIREFQLEVTSSTVNPPFSTNVQQNTDGNYAIYAAPGDSISFAVSMTDLSHSVTSLQGIGECFINGNTAAFSTTQGTAWTGIFRWKALPSHLRCPAYIVVFRSFIRDSTAIRGKDLTVLVYVQQPTQVCNYPRVSVEDHVMSIPQLSISPNPFSKETHLRISGSQPIRDGKLTLFNMLGQQLQEIPVTSGDLILRAEGLDKGIYLYRFTAKHRRTDTGKLVIE